MRERELAGLEVEQVGTEDVARQQVGRELDAPEIEPGGGGEALREERLGGTRRPFEQHVALRDERDQQVLDRLLLADDGLADFGADGVGELPGLFERRGHRASVLSMVLSAPAARSNSWGVRAWRKISARCAKSAATPRA